MVPAPIITASTRVRRQTSISVSDLLPIGPERPCSVARPSTVTAKLVTTYGRSSGALAIRSSWMTCSGIEVGPGSGISRRIARRTLAVQLGEVLDVRAVALLAAWLCGKPGVEDLRQLRLGGRAEAEREHVGVVPAPGARGRLGVDTQRCTYAGDLVCRDRGARARPAADDPLLGPPLGDVARRVLARPRPVVAFGVVQRTVRDRLVPTLAELIDHSAGDPHTLVGGNGNS